MKIALVGNYPPPHGGVSVHVAALAAALRSRGADVRVLDIGRGDHRAPGVRPARGPLRYGAALAAAAAERRLVHVHTSGANPRSWAVAHAAVRARLPGGPRPLLTLHSGLCPAFLAASPARRDAARQVCSRAGAVVAVNRELRDALLACGVPLERVTVLPAFLGSGLTPGAPPRRLAAVRQACAPLYCAAVAPTPTYGEDLLLAAFAALRRREPRAGLVVFGPGSERGPSAAIGLGGGVLALGELDHAEALAVIAACDVFVRPTRADGDALTVREALSLGRTVVASDVGHRPPGCLLFPAGDARGLGARLAEASRRAAAPPVGRVAPVRAPIEVLLELYRALAAGRAPPAEPPRTTPPIPSDSSAALEAPCSPA